MEDLPTKKIFKEHNNWKLACNRNTPASQLHISQDKAISKVAEYICFEMANMFYVSDLVYQK